MNENITDIFLNGFQDCLLVQDQIYSPLTLISKIQIKKEINRRRSSATLTEFCNFQNQSNEQFQILQEKVNDCSWKKQAFQNKCLRKIIQKSKTKNLLCQKQKQDKVQLNFNAEIYSFNLDYQLNFQNTPVFKNNLQSPFSRFNKNYKIKIQQLLDVKLVSQNFNQLNLDTNPCLFIDKAASFFMGIALKAQKQQRYNQSFYYLKLACFVQPFNKKVWIETINLAKKIGRWKDAVILSKTGFLFNPTSQIAQQYLLSGDKNQTPMFELRGLLTSLKNPFLSQKLIIQFSRYQIKNRKNWRGMVLLYYFILNTQTKNSLNYGLSLLIKMFCVFSLQKIALQILVRFLDKKINRLEIFFIFIELCIIIQGQLLQSNLSILEYHSNNIAPQSRYKVPLAIAEATAITSRKQFGKYILRSYELANKYCKNGSGKSRALREIYFTIISHFGIPIKNNMLQFYKNDELLIFMSNKYRFIHNQPLFEYNFKDWKFYLHYSLVKNSNILLKATKKFNQGRLMAEAIHVLRLTKKPLVMLKLWRNKIQFMLKSGQLWCEGGRIFVNIKQYQNAIKCFKYAIHFTPQFGDSYFELLQIYLLKSNFQAIHQLKKNFIISQPSYGNVLLFIQKKFNPNNFKSKITLSKIWDFGQMSIQNQIYNHKYDLKTALTAAQAYNIAYIDPQGEYIRNILFSSYQEMENRSKA